MFEFISTVAETTVRYTYKDNVVNFTIDTINKRLKDEIIPETMFKLLNGYIAYKGNAFASELYKTLLNSSNELLLQTSIRDVDPMPLHIVHDVLNMFDFNDVYDYIKSTGLVRVPTNLADKYDKLIELDEKGTREQTYLKRDYMELIALITILKSTLGIVGEYASIKSDVLAKNDYREYILFTFYASHSIFRTPAFQKVYDGIHKLIERLFSDRDNTAIRLIERTIDKDTFPTYITAYVTIQKLLVNSELSDTDSRNTVTKIYHFASNKIKLKDNASEVRIKHIMNGEDDSGESESVMESYRTPTTLPPGSILEFRNEFKCPIELSRNLGLNVSDDVIYEMVDMFRKLEEPLPINESLYLASYVFKDIIDPRAFDHLVIDELINALAVAFLYLWEKGYRDIALILSSFSSSVDNFKVNFSLRNKLKQNVRDELDRIFPYKKVIVGPEGNTETSSIDETITLLSKNLMGYNLVSILPKRYLDEGNNGSRNVLMDETIKNRLARYIIFINDGHVEDE